MAELTENIKTPKYKYLVTYSHLDIERTLGIFNTEQEADVFIQTLCQEPDWAEDSVKDGFFIEPIINHPSPNLFRYWEYGYGITYTEWEGN